MASLFELFVAEWLSANLPAELELEAQERLDLGGDIHFCADLILRRRSCGRPLAVLDTKYKAAEAPATSDVAQVVAYAEAAGCREAMLVYPQLPARGRLLQVGRIRVRSLAFELAGDLELSGRALLGSLLSRAY